MRTTSFAGVVALALALAGRAYAAVNIGAGSLALQMGMTDTQAHQAIGGLPEEDSVEDGVRIETYYAAQGMFGFLYVIYARDVVGGPWTVRSWSAIEGPSTAH
jgi:hypothetical protein